MGMAGTEIAREAADVVLQNDSYASIVTAIREGRIIYNNIRKFIFYEFGFMAAQVMVIIFSLILGLPHVMMPIHVVIIDMIIGLLPSMALGIDPPNPQVMKYNADQFQDQLLPTKTRWRILRISIIVAIGAILGFLTTPDYILAATTVYATISLSYLGLALGARSNKRKLHLLMLKPNALLNYAVVISIMFLLMTIYIPGLGHILHTAPMPLFNWIIALTTTLAAVLVDDIFKPHSDNEE